MKKKVYQRKGLINSKKRKIRGTQTKKKLVKTKTKHFTIKKLY